MTIIGVIILPTSPKGTLKKPYLSFLLYLLFVKKDVHDATFYTAQTFAHLQKHFVVDMGNFSHPV